MCGFYHSFLSINGLRLHNLDSYFAAIIIITIFSIVVGRTDKQTFNAIYLFLYWPIFNVLPFCWASWIRVFISRSFVYLFCSLTTIISFTVIFCLCHFLRLLKIQYIAKIMSIFCQQFDDFFLHACIT